MKHKSYIDSKTYRIRKDGSCLRVNGWYLDDSGRPADFSALINGRPARLTLKRRSRPDAAGRYARWNPPPTAAFPSKCFPKTGRRCASLSSGRKPRAGRSGC